MAEPDLPDLIVHLPRLRRYARALTGDATSADDLVQDTLERAWARLHQWRAPAEDDPADPSERLRAWLFTLMHNVHVNQLRQHRLPTDPLDELQDELQDDPALPVVSGGQLEPLPLRLVRAAQGGAPTSVSPPQSGNAGRWRLWSRAGSGRAATAALVCGLVGLAVGGGLGYRLGQGGQTAGVTAASGRFVHDAALAHAVYTPEQRHPVEVDARQADHLVAWLSKRLGTPLHAPQLAPLGYELLGGRLLAAGEGPVAQFMYQNAAGARLTLYVRRAAPAGVMPADTLTAFQVAREGDVEVFYWVEDGFGYALSGRVARPQLQAVAEAVYHQLTAPPAAASAP